MLEMPMTGFLSGNASAFADDREVLIPENEPGPMPAAKASMSVIDSAAFSRIVGRREKMSSLRLVVFCADMWALRLCCMVHDALDRIVLLSSKAMLAVAVDCSMAKIFIWFTFREDVLYT